MVATVARPCAKTSPIGYPPQVTVCAKCRPRATLTFDPITTESTKILEETEQTSNGGALLVGLVPREERKRVVK